MTTEEEMEEKARAEAQARRQRILDAADNRLDRVSGLQPASQDDGEEKKKSTGSSKLAAMRRRRFKKKTEDTKTVEEEEDVKQTPDTVAAKQTEEPKKAEEKPQDKEVVEEDVVEEVNTPGVQKDEKKKYMGVAKMRRKMLQERKKEQAAAGATSSSSSSTPHVVLKPTKTVAQQTADRIAILMHVIIVVLLFAAGLDVGLQNKLDYGDGPSAAAAVVHTGLAPSTEKPFMKLVPRFLLPDNNNSQEGEHNFIKVVADDKEEYQPAEGDEFGDDKPHVAKEANIDPLFGLDLDEYTSGPGLYMMLARGAVFLHRCNLAIFYYGPKKVATGIGAMVNSLVSIPPLLAIIALVLRQVIGNQFLGAHLPVLIEEEEKKNDVMSMIANFVKTFLAGMFPNAIGLYKGWMLLRADMYVVVCGLMVGLAWQHSRLLSETETPGRDEL